MDKFGTKKVSRHAKVACMALEASSGGRIERREGDLTSDESVERPETKLFTLENTEALPTAKRVMFTFDNPGAYAGLSPLIATLMTDGRCKSISVIASGWGSHEFRKDRRFGNFSEELPSHDPEQRAHETLLAETLRETERHEPDVVVASSSVKDGPESVALFGGRSNLGAQKVYLFSDGWGSIPQFLKNDRSLVQKLDIDGVFCCDELAKELAMRALPGTPEEVFIITGSPAMDALYVEDSESFVRETRKKLQVTDDQIAILYAGDVSSDYRNHSDVDSENINVRTFERTFEAIRKVAIDQPDKKFVLLVRPHPREAEQKKEELLAYALDTEKSSNIEVRKADADSDISSKEVMWAADAVASIMSTQNFHAPRIGRPSVFLSFTEEGLGNAVVQRAYGDLISDIQHAEPLTSFVHSPEELAQVIARLNRAPTKVEKPDTETTSIQKIPSGLFGTDQWVHGAVTYDQNVVNVYVNGVLESSTPCSQTLDYTSAKIDMTPPNGDHIGSFDDVRIYNRALSAAEVQQLYHLGQTNSTNFVTPFRWTDRKSAGSRAWKSIASSADGGKLAAVVFNGDIYTSINSGATWTDQTAAGSRGWQRIASSADGTKLAAVVFSGDVYTSTDSGATWTDQTAAGSRNWIAITSSSDGTKLAAAGISDIYTSTDSGATWTDQTAAGSRGWVSITSSSDGSKLAAVDQTGGDIWTSTDSGATWTDQTAAGSRTWVSITSSSDGTKLAAAAIGDIYTSTDGGATWSDRSSAGSRSWATITSSSDGRKLAATAQGPADIRTSTDGGATWTDQTAAGSRNWVPITSSSDGSKLAASANGSDIWTATRQGTVTIGHSNIGNANGLVGYWTFDGPNTHWNTNTTDDLSGQGNTGTLVGMATGTSQVAGKIGQALSFNGSNYTTVGDVTSLNLSHTGSVFAWVKPNSPSGNGVVVAKGDVYNDVNAYGIYFQSLFVYAEIDGGPGHFTPVSVSSLLFPQGKWTYVGLVWDGSRVYEYVNGLLQSSLSQASDATPSGFPLNIGADGLNSASNKFNGTIDDVRIYNRALGPQEIQQLYVAGR